MESSDPLPLLVPLFILIILLALMCAAFLGSFLLAQRLASTSGLNQLTKKYLATRKPESLLVDHQTLQVNSVRYRRCVSIGISPAGFYLWVRPRLLQHPPALIPWNEMKPERETRLYWQPAMQLSVGEPQVAKLIIPMRLFDELKLYLVNCSAERVLSE